MLELLKKLFKKKNECNGICEYCTCMEEDENGGYYCSIGMDNDNYKS